MEDFRMMCADASCAVVLITMGVLLGRMTPVQFLLLAFFETSISVLVDHIVVNILHVGENNADMDLFFVKKTFRQTKNGKFPFCWIFDKHR